MPASSSASASAAAARPRPRQASSALLRFGRVVVMGGVAVVILVAGVWASWGTAQYVVLTKGREP